MEHKKTRMLISILLVVICVLISLQGCGFLSRWRTPTEEEGISIGFQYENSQGSLVTAIKSDKKVFEIDDVTLDFYYGGIASDSLSDSVALYFISGRNNLFTDLIVDDYKNIDGCYFIKEMTIEEYESGPFDIEQRWGPKQKNEKNTVYFHFVDTLTVPKEVFSESQGEFYFIAAYLRTNKENNLAEVHNPRGANRQILYYTKMEDGYVELNTRR